MLGRDERRIRRRECLELEAHYGQFLPCERYADPEDTLRKTAESDRPTLTARMLAAAMNAARALRDVLRTP